MTSQRLDLAYQYCMSVTRAHYENFPVASILAPRRLRPAIAAIYAFSRIADDFSDEPEFEGRRAEYLDDWEVSAKQLMTRPAVHPVFIALQDTITRFGLPLQLLLDLLAAFKLDLVKTRYETDDELLSYCRYSANPVGRLVLLLSGYRDPELLELSDKICTALQLANHWQDLSIDTTRDRIYVPYSRMAAHHATPEDFLLRRDSAATRAVIGDVVDWAEMLFKEGYPLIPQLKGRLRFEIQLTWCGGMRILDKIRKLDYRTLLERPALTKRDGLGLLINALGRSPL